jgi:hypothetical protein
MKKQIHTPVKIVTQGAVRVTTTAFVIRKSKNLVAIDVDLKSKYCVSGGVGIGIGENWNGIYIEATKNTLRTKKGKKISEDTVIVFPKYLKWDVFATAITGKYSLSVCLIKK